MTGNAANAPLKEKRVRHRKTEPTGGVVTHEMGFAREVASRVLFMADGNIVEDDAPEQVFDNPKSQRLQDFLSKVL